jgi:hypothetical protein
MPLGPANSVAAVSPARRTRVTDPRRLSGDGPGQMDGSPAVYP